MFTRTVNVGDTGVSITMTQLSDPDVTGRLSNWRKDGGNEISSQSGSLTYPLPDPIQASDDGIYEIYYDRERSLGRGALYRIIVRGNIKH